MSLLSPLMLCGVLPMTAALYARLPRTARAGAACLGSFALLWLLLGKDFLIYIFALLFVLAATFLPRALGIAAVTAAFFLCRFFFGAAAGLAFLLPRAIWMLREGRPRDLSHAVAYLCFFPTVASGPICAPRDFALADPAWETARRGIWRIGVGLCKKLWLADGLYRAFGQFTTGTTLSAWAKLVCFALYLYFDFSGYTDVAVGAAALYGIRLPENFDFPYAARSVGDFFRRWHASLGRFFFHNVYLPLGGSKHGTLRTLCALGAVWLCTALWHGFSRNYLLWGALFFALSALEKCLFASHSIGRLATLGAVLLGWVFFFTATPREAFVFFAKLACAGDTLLYTRADFYPFCTKVPFLLLAMFFATPLVRPLRDPPRLLVYLGTPVLFTLAAAAWLAGGHRPFLYASY